jgi:hypothetical protein
MQDYIKVIGDEELPKVPYNLDCTPYRDFHDSKLLRVMLKGMVGTDGKPAQALWSPKKRAA